MIKFMKELGIGTIFKYRGQEYVLAGQFGALYGNHLIEGPVTWASNYYLTITMINNLPAINGFPGECRVEVIKEPK